MGNLTLTHERIDDIPLLLSLGQTLELDQAVNAPGDARPATRADEWRPGDYVAGVHSGGR